jgi:hypothetical protein
LKLSVGELEDFDAVLLRSSNGSIFAIRRDSVVRVAPFGLKITKS